MRRIFIILTVIATLATAFPVFAEEILPPDPSLSGDFTSQYMGERMMVDFFILRPLGVASTVIATTSAVLMFPLACATNSTDQVKKELIDKPFDYTYKRPLGDINF